MIMHRHEVLCTVVLSCAALAACLLLACPAQAVPVRPGTSASVGNAGCSCRSHAGVRVTPADVAAAQRARADRAPNAALQEDGGAAKLPLVLIVVGFSDVPYSNSYDWNAKAFGDGGLCDFYSDMSLGKFTFEPVSETSAYGTDGNANSCDRADDGIVHVTVPLMHGAWFTDSRFDNIGMLAAFRRAVRQAGTYVRFADYDADRDGLLETDELAVGIVVAGREAAALSDERRRKLTGSERRRYLWSHAWNLNALGAGAAEVGGVRVDDYIAIAEDCEEDDGSIIQEPLSVLYHELGHYLGLPDLYDTAELGSAAWSDYEVGYLSLMASGMWNYVEGVGGTRTYVPAAFDAWSRCFLKWVDPVTVRRRGTYCLGSQDAEEGYGVLRVDTPAQGEYYLLENRQASGYDAGLAGRYENAGGIVLWHVDDGIVDSCLADNTVNVSSHRPGVMPLFHESDCMLDAFEGAGACTLLCVTPASRPDVGEPFFDKNSWDRMYAFSESPLASALSLLLPYVGSAATPAQRTFYEAHLAFPSPSASSMAVEVAFGAEHADTPATPPADTPAVDTAPVRVSVPKAKLKSVKAGKRKFTVKWAALSGIAGYQLSWRKGTGAWKTLTFSGGKKSHVVKKLTRKKKYQVRVRAFAKSAGKTYYGPWSASKKVKVG